MLSAVLTSMVESESLPESDEILPTFEMVSFLDVVSPFASGSIGSDDSVELFAEKVPSHPNHGDRDCREISDHHKKEEDCLLPVCGCGYVVGGKTCDGHSRDTNKQAVDEWDVGGSVGCVEDGCCNEGCEDEDDDMDTLKAESGWIYCQ